MNPLLLFNRIIELLLFTPYALLWCYYWISFIILFLLFSKKTIFKKVPLFIILVCTLQLIVYYVIYIITPYDVIGQYLASINRELLHMVPISVILLGILLEKKRNLFVSNLDKNSKFKKFIIYLSITIFCILTIYTIMAYLYNWFYFMDI